MSDNEIVNAEQVDVAMWHVGRERDAGHISYPLCKRLERLGASHEALRAERDAYAVGDAIARRHADGWHPVFRADPAKCRWVPWNDGDPEPMTEPEIDWYRRHREQRR